MYSPGISASEDDIPSQIPLLWVSLMEAWEDEDKFKKI